MVKIKSDLAESTYLTSPTWGGFADMAPKKQDFTLTSLSFTQIHDVYIYIYIYYINIHTSNIRYNTYVQANLKPVF